MLILKDAHSLAGQHGWQCVLTEHCSGDESFFAEDVSSYADGLGNKYGELGSMALGHHHRLHILQDQDLTEMLAGDANYAAHTSDPHSQSQLYTEMLLASFDKRNRSIFDGQGPNNGWRRLISLRQVE